MVTLAQSPKNRYFLAATVRKIHIAGKFTSGRIQRMNPWHRLPPLRSLRVLEAAVRHENYTKAAGELNLTHSAVSHQIHALEENLGTRGRSAGTRTRALRRSFGLMVGNTSSSKSFSLIRPS